MGSWASLVGLTALAAALLVAPDGSPAQTQEGTDIRPVELRRVDAAAPRLVPGDEVDALEKRIKPKARFAGYRPRWRVEARTFTFKHYQRTETRDDLRVVLDGDKVVALARSGDILLIARTPETAKTRIDMPTERLHLDNLLGPSLPTWQFIKKVKAHGSIYETLGDKALPKEWWEAGKGRLTFVRTQSLPEYDVAARFVFTVDPVYGYRIDAVRDVRFAQQPKAGTAVRLGSFCPGCYVPWDYAAVYDRTAWTPINGGIRGWANNLLCMDRCDGDKKNFAWRDGGFIAYLPDREGWSPCFTRADGTGNTPPLAVCNAHNDFHIKITLKDLPKVETGKYRFHAVHRLLSLPPEMTAHVWDNVQLIQKGRSAIVIKIGRVEDFEDQPVPLTAPARGLIWTSGGPRLAEGVARSGSKSLLIKGRAWPNLPQVSLKPNVRYRLEGYFKVVPWTEEQLAAAKAKDRSRRESLKKRGRPVPPEIDWANLRPQAYISGDFYEWSPHSGKMLVKQKTTTATAETDGWQHVVLDFTSPGWGPFINIAFHAEHCDAYLDDFALREVTGNPAPAGGRKGAR
jgi:hypothetical protein